MSYAVGSTGLCHSTASLNCASSSAAVLHAVAACGGSLRTLRIATAPTTAMSYASGRLAYCTLATAFGLAGTSAVVLKAAVASAVGCADASVHLAPLAASMGKTKGGGTCRALRAA